MVQPPDPPSRAYWWVVAFFVGAAGLWTAYKAMTIAKPGAGRVLYAGAGLALAAVALGGAMRFTERGPIDWTYYTHERFEAAKAARQVVVMDFTAEWCLNCKALEESVLNDPGVAATLGTDGIVPIKVDLTGNNREGSEMLRRTGRITIPLLIVYGRDGSPVFQGDFYTVEQVLGAVREAQAEGVSALR
jgi:thiol:disulfide interchange protein